MNELVHFKPEQIKAVFPSFFEGFQRAFETFQKIKSWDDVELYLLRGQGLAAGTYRTYLTAVRQLYEFTDGLHPFHVSAGHIEAFYDHVSKRVDRNSAYHKIMALKRFFVGLKNIVPGYVSPFDTMDERLAKKLSRTKKTATKKALTAKEARALLELLEKDSSEAGKSVYAMVYMLLTSGLRAAELCSLRWADLDFAEETWTARFVGKGGKEAVQELYCPAVEAAKRQTRPGREFIFYTLPRGKGSPIKPLGPHALWYLLKKVYAKARAAGVLQRELPFSPHLFRRTYATLLYKGGMKLKPSWN